MATALEIRGKVRESQGKSGKVKSAKIVRKKSGNLKKKWKVREKSGNFKNCPKVKVLPFLRFNLIISVSTKILYQAVREISLRSGKVREDESQEKGKFPSKDPQGPTFHV